ncbi:hypothetical protein PN446_12245 [Microcystis aeruginosa CS-567/02]|nr:hypothetical protein [Microcystis aeruginosa]MDB9413312.1 hypothetical protein [Microcystis aeruginosa CS-567/02]
MPHRCENRYKRPLLSSLAGFWYSTIYADYFINNFSWVPSPIPFFMLVFALLYRFQMETTKPLLYQAIAWILLGITVAILVSLHSTTMLIIPVTCVITCLWFVYRNRLFWFLCGNEVYTDSFFDKIVLKVLPDKHFTIP